MKWRNQNDDDDALMKKIEFFVFNILADEYADAFLNTVLKRMYFDKKIDVMQGHWLHHWKAETINNTFANFFRLVISWKFISQ